jgi:hypothetical protein
MVLVDPSLTARKAPARSHGSIPINRSNRS